MDIQLSTSKNKKKRIFIWIVTSISFLVIIALPSLIIEPQVPKISTSDLWIEKVKKGDLTLKVGGTGTLIPEEQRWITAQSQGNVEQIILLPGAKVEPSSIILDLSNPQLQQNLRNTQLELAAAQAELSNQKAKEEDGLLEMQYQLAQLNANYENAKLDMEVNKELFSEGLIAKRDLLKSEVAVTLLKKQNDILIKRIKTRTDTIEEILAPFTTTVKQEKEKVILLKQQVEALKVRAGVYGVLQHLPLQKGQQVEIGTKLAQVANPSQLKAVIRIPETQAKDVKIGQHTKIDNRNDIITGEVMRIDPAVENGLVNIDIKITESLPSGARAGQSVEAQIELKNMENALYVERPAFGHKNSQWEVFVITDNGQYAEKRQITFGDASVREIEITSGLTLGEQIILSDTTEWSNFKRLRLY